MSFLRKDLLYWQKKGRRDPPRRGSFSRENLEVYSTQESELSQVVSLFGWGTLMKIRFGRPKIADGQGHSQNLLVNPMTSSQISTQLFYRSPCPCADIRQAAGRVLSRGLCVACWCGEEAVHGLREREKEKDEKRKGRALVTGQYIDPRKANLGEEARRALFQACDPQREDVEVNSRPERTPVWEISSRGKIHRAGFMRRGSLHAARE
jgi:hypothetical protein